MPRRNRDHRRGTIGVASGVLLFAAACTERIETESSRFDFEGMPPQLPPLIAPEVLDERAARADITAEATPLGFIEADGVSPPATSPDGRFVAVQLPPAPAWIDLVAWRGGMPQPAPAIALIPVESSGGLGTPLVPREPLLLGRTATADGVLVEGPRPDGSRRIGVAAWTTGKVEWLIDDGGVATMAALGPDGELAWCRSERPGAPAGLRLLGRGGTLREWPPPAESTWMMPTFSGDGTRLFALLLEDGRARLVAFDLDAPGGEVETWSFSDRIDAPSALRAVLAAGPDASPPGASSWLLLHPEWNGLFRWHPADDRFDRLPRGTYLLTRPLGSGRLLLDAEGVWHVGGIGGDAGSTLDLLLEGPWIPRVIERSTPRAADTVLLFRPDSSGYQVVELVIGAPDRIDDNDD